MILHYIVDGWFIVGEHGYLSLSWCDLFVFLVCFLLLNFTFEMCESFVLWRWYLESRSFSITPRQMFCIFFYCSVISRLSFWIISIQWSRIILYHSSSLRFLKYNFGDVWKIPYSHTIYIKLRYWMLFKKVLTRTNIFWVLIFNIMINAALYCTKAVNTQNMQLPLLRRTVEMRDREESLGKTKVFFIVVKTIMVIAIHATALEFVTQNPDSLPLLRISYCEYHSWDSLTFLSDFI